MRKDREVRIARETYPWSFRNGKPSHGGDRNDFNLAYRNPCLLPAIIYQRNPDRSRKLWNIISTEGYICRTYNSVFRVIVNTCCPSRPIYYLPFLCGNWNIRPLSATICYLLCSCSCYNWNTDLTCPLTAIHYLAFQSFDWAYLNYVIHETRREH